RCRSPLLEISSPGKEIRKSGRARSPNPAGRGTSAATSVTYLSRYFATPIFLIPGTLLPVPLNQTKRFALGTFSFFERSPTVTPFFPADRNVRTIFSFNAPRLLRR